MKSKINKYLKYHKNAWSPTTIKNTSYILNKWGGFINVNAEKVWIGNLRDRGDC